MNIIPLFCENARKRIFQTPHVVYAPANVVTVLRRCLLSRLAILEPRNRATFG